MSTRHQEWHLLGEGSDPWPGDPERVASQARSLRETAQAIEAQVTRLRQLKDDQNVLIGEFRPALTDDLDDLAEALGQAQGRFEEVSGELYDWAPVLREARNDSLRYVLDAEEADEQRRLNQPEPGPIDPTDQAAQDAADRKQDRYDAAGDALSTAQRLFRDLRHDTDAVARRVARNIRAASDDKVKDGRFAGLRKWIHEHKDLLKFIAQVLSWIATITVIAILLLSNPAGWIVLIGLLATMGSLLINTVLAANGDGSWLDVAMDAFALLTLGAGRLLTGGAKIGLGLRTGFMPAFRASSSAARAAFSNARGLGKAVTYVTRSNVVVRGLTSWTKGWQAYDDVIRTSLNGPSRFSQRFLFGDRETAALYNGITRALQNPTFAGSRLLQGSLSAMNGVRNTFIAGSLVDIGGKALFPSLDVSQFGIDMPYGDGNVVWHPGMDLVDASMNNFGETSPF